MMHKRWKTDGFSVEGRKVSPGFTRSFKAADISELSPSLWVILQKLRDESVVYLRINVQDGGSVAVGVGLIQRKDELN